jgi:surfactin synthase thioesterase subunit
MSSGELMDSVSGQGSSELIRVFRPVSSARLRLVCCPHAGASAAAYGALARALPADIEALTVDYPDRRGDNGGFASIEDLADRVSAALTPWSDRRDQPLAVYGHSMGSVVAFEVARRLAAAGTEVTRLFVSGRRSPSAGLGTRLPSTDEEIITELSALGGIPQRLLDKPKFRKPILHVIRHDYRANSGYLAPSDAVLRAPITFLLAEADDYVDLADAEAWRAHTTGDFRVVRFPGGHFFLNEQLLQVVETIVADLEAYPCPRPSAVSRPE